MLVVNITSLFFLLTLLLLPQGTNHEMPMSREAEQAIQNKWVEMRQHAQSA
jgi:hypothetical protein